MSWTTAQAKSLYQIAHWGDGYFDVNDTGEVIAYPQGSRQGPSVNLHRLNDELAEHGLCLPVLVRFIDILHHRVDRFCAAFDNAMAQAAFDANYTAVYPIKVNQQRDVVQEILTHGGPRVGLEAGSKPELLATLALAPPNGGLIICNGYKDREYIRLALIGQQMGLRPFIVVEKSSELELIISESKRMGVRPNIGVRLRLASIAAGKWQNTGGEKAKFGLSSGQVLQVLARLRDADMLDTLQLMHFHVGSQVPNIRDIQRALGEAGRYFSELRRLGAPLHYVDLGGGLGVDYDGTHSRGFSSINYSLEEYANNVVRMFSFICQEHNLQPPHFITECGRAMSAHHAVLMMNITDVEQAPGDVEPAPPAQDEPLILQELWQTLTGLTERSVSETWHNATYWLSEAYQVFTHGGLELEQRARAEQLYFTICRRLQARIQPGVRSHREILDELNDRLADKYFANFSLFQSIPDVWAIDQLFPIMPLHRLDEQPNRRATLQDLTCDSDGHIEWYVDAEGIESSLPLHSLKPGEEYLLGVFLVGAYQEILGDLHNLFGDTHAVNVALQADGSYRLVGPETGDTVEDVLGYVHFDIELLRARYRQRLKNAGLDTDRQQAYLVELLAGLQGYTYLER